ncbi:MAG TPA: DUF4230 domain-containing protein, partial [Chthoniobacterales bacterium]
PVAFAVIFLLAAALGALIFWRIETWPMRTAQQASAELERIGRQARDTFLQIARMQPRVTINSRVYLEQTTGVLELALVSRRTEVEQEFEHSWAGSTKRVKLHGTYNVKAGFDLRENVTVDVRNDAIAVQLPRATILGVEQEKVDVLELENGYWNRISAEDLENEFARLPKLARERAQQANLTAEAETALQKQLQERLGTAGRPVVVTFAPAAEAKP